MSRSHRTHTKPIIGLTGGIGSGKSTVARMLASLGGGVIDSDRLSHEQLADPNVVATLCSWWGEPVRSSDGSADRKALARIVFDDPAQLARLEGLVYPRIERRRRKLMAQFEADPVIKAIVLDTPKLLESGLNDECDGIVFVEADRRIRVRRVADSRGWTEDDLDRRESMLNPLDKKRSVADHILVNHTGIAELRRQVEQVFSSVLASFA